MERILKAETLLPLLVATLLALGLVACKKEEPNGPQYTLNATFLANTRSDFPLGTRWVYVDAARGDAFRFVLNDIDSLILQAGPGYPGYMYYRLGFQLLPDSSVIALPQDSIVPIDTITLADPPRDSIVYDTLRRDTIVTRSWRVLPYESVLAGNILGSPEQAVFFFDSTMAESKTKQGLTYLGTQPLQVNANGTSVSVVAHRFSSPGAGSDSLSATELFWAPHYGLVRFKTLSGREFVLDSLKR